MQREACVMWEAGKVAQMLFVFYAHSYAQVRGKQRREVVGFFAIIFAVCQGSSLTSKADVTLLIRDRLTVVIHMEKQRKYACHQNVNIDSLIT